MSKRLDDTSRDILEFRPEIDFVEPEVQPGPIKPVVEDVSFEDVLKDVEETRKLAKAVDTLATAIQAKADIHAKGMVIKLDSRVDSPTIAAMKRLHPEANSREITYEQYTECKEDQRNKGLELGKQGIVKPEDITAAAAAPFEAGLFSASGFNTDAGRTGGLRPELSEVNQIFAPFDLEELQNILIRLLVNFIWKNFIKGALPLPPGISLFMIPDEICEMPEGVSVDGFIETITDLVKTGKDQLEGIPTAEQAIQKAMAQAGNLKLDAKAQMKAISASEAELLADADTASTGDRVQSPTPRQSNTAAKPASPLSTGFGNPLRIQDCFTITKTFERAAAYCTTEQSVFALLRPTLNNMRVMARAYEEQALGNEALLSDIFSLNQSDDQTAGSDMALSIDNSLSSIVEDAEGPGAKKKRTYLGSKEWAKDCIPCDFRPEFYEDLFVRLQVGLMDKFLRYRDWFKHILEQLRKITELFAMDISYKEICALISFFKDFVCLPDLRRIIAILTMLLMRVAFEISGLFDIILSFIAPLILPFLSGIIDTIEKFLLMVVKPIECIIDAITNIFLKLDYSVLFQYGQLSDFNVSIGPQGKTLQTPDIKLKYNAPKIVSDTLGINIPAETTIVPAFSDIPTPDWGADFNLLDTVPGLDATTAGKSKNWNVRGVQSVGDHMRAEEQAVRESQAELESVRQKRSDVDFSDAEARELYLTELEVARQKRSNAVDERDFTANQRIREALQTVKIQMRSAIMTVARYLREAIQAIEGFVKDLTDEFLKLIASWFGNGDLEISLKFKKLEIVKIIGMVVSLISWLVSGANCDDPEQEEVDVTLFIPSNQQRSIIVRDDGMVQIIEKPELIEEAINTVAGVIGADPFPKLGAEVIGTPVDRSRQKLNSLIEFTGDPVLDTEIAKVVDAITIPAQDIFKCPLQTSVAQAEQVNKWMRELNTK